MKDIAARAEISTGRVYHHFSNKLELFEQLLEAYWKILRDPDLKLNKLIAAARFPDDIEDLAWAIKEIVQENYRYVNLIYIDVIEFNGEHVNRIYANMANNFRTAYEKRFEELRREGRLKDGADPYFAVMMTYRFFFHYFVVETSFGVKDHFGLGHEAFVQQSKFHILNGLIDNGGGV